MTNLPVTGDFYITAIYGQNGNLWSNGHKGIDFVSDNKKVYSTCVGTVRVVAFDKGGWGNYISVGDANGLRHIFCHLDSIFVKAGDKVSEKTVLGIMGQTGNVTGVHLHYQLNNADGLPIDPTKHLGVPNVKGKYNSKEFTVMEYKDQSKISSWAKDAVKKVTQAGIMAGDTNGNFNPQKQITREEIAVVISNLLEKE